MQSRLKKILVVAAAQAAFVGAGVASGQTTAPFTYTSTGDGSDWTQAAAWTCTDADGRPCSGQPDYPQDSAHIVVIADEIFLDTTVTIASMEITGAGLLSVDCGAEVLVGSDLTVKSGGMLNIYGDLVVKQDMFIDAHSNVPAERGQAWVQGACAFLEVEGELWILGYLEVYGDGASEAVVDVHQRVTIEARNTPGSIEGEAVVGNAEGHGRLYVRENLTIQATPGWAEFGELNVIAGAAVLTMENTVDPQHPVGGDINLESDVSILLVLDDAELVAYHDGVNEIPGEIRGMDDDASVQIADGRAWTLGEGMALRGALAVAPESGSATFINLGIVEANSPFGTTLSFAESLDVTDGDAAPYGLWMTTVEDATLEFNESLQLNGDFEVTGGGIVRVTGGTPQDPNLVLTTGNVTPNPQTNPDGCIKAEEHACFGWRVDETFPPDQICDDQIGTNCPSR